MAGPILLTSEYRLRRWGLYWIIFGSFTLLDGLLHLDNDFIPRRVYLANLGRDPSEVASPGRESKMNNLIAKIRRL